MKYPPKVSVITISLNSEKEIESTIKSVLCQNYTNLEYIIIDGASTDKTIDIIKQYSKYIDFWISEKDKNIYDAMNKGVKNSSGEWIIFMNAGDKFYSCNVLNNIFNINNWSLIEKADLIYGNVCKKYHNNLYKIEKPKSMDKLWKGMTFSHQTLFTKRNLLIENPFDISLYIAADFDFIYKMYKKQKNFLYVDQIVAEIDMSGISNKKRLKSIMERYKVISKYENSLKVKLYYNWLTLDTIFRNTIKFILPKKLVEFIIKYKP